MVIKTCQDVYDIVKKLNAGRSISEIQISFDRLKIRARVNNIDESTRIQIVHFNSVPFFTNPALKGNQIIAVIDKKVLFYNGLSKVNPVWENITSQLCETTKG